MMQLPLRFGSDWDARIERNRRRSPATLRISRLRSGPRWPEDEMENGSVISSRVLTAGTIFQDTPQPLTLWFRAMGWVTSQKNGASALGLQRILGLGSYKTAWSWLHKLRRAMVRPGRDRLSGRVEVDETYLGGTEKGTSGRKMEKKALIVVAAQEDGHRIGRIRMKRVPDASADSLLPFVEASVKPGSVVHTDGWESYRGLEETCLPAGRKDMPTR